MEVYLPFEIDYQHPDEQWDSLVVEYIGYMRMENDGIGGYEYWGSTGYDKGNDYYECDEVHWDKSLYNDFQNDVINKYLRDNWEKVTEKLIKNIDPEYGL